jgi:hypothetical protein
MASNLVDSPNVFHRLCHLAALSREGKMKAAVDNLILSIFTINKDFAPTTAKQVVECIDSYFTLPLKEATVQSSIDTHLSNGRLIRNRATKTLSLSSSVRAEMETHINEANNLERQVREEWFTTLDTMESLTSPMKEQLWRGLQSYMASAFKRHGAETVLLLDPSNPISSEIRGTLSTYLDEAVKAHCNNITREMAFRLITGFFTDSPTNRTRYIAQLLDGTFTYYAITVDQFAAIYLKEGIAPLSLFLDTNFIFAILDFGDNPLKDVSLELLEVVKKYNLPFKLYFHEETLNELRRVIGTAGDSLRGRHWSQAMSRAAIQAGFLHGVTLRYHQLNAETTTDPEVFLSKYEYIEELLADHGLTIYRVAADKAIDEKRHLLVAEYRHFIEASRPQWPKPYEALNHDMAVWQTVSRLRKRSATAFGVGAYFLTTDYFLYRFDWQRLREKDTLGVVVLSNQFLQLLRPFIPTDRELDESFVEIFSIPEFRTLVRDYSRTSEKVFTYLSTYADISEGTAVRILTDEVLAQQLRDVKEDSEEFHGLIESAMARDNEQLRQQAEIFKADAEAARESTRIANEKIRTSETIVRQREESLQLLEEQKNSVLETAREVQRNAEIAERRIAEAEQKVERVTTDAAIAKQEHNEAIAGLQRQLKAYASVARIIVGVTFAALGTLIVILVGALINWSWLNNHPNRLGLLASAVLFFICAGWAIADTKRRNIALLALLIPLLMAVLPMLGK